METPHDPRCYSGSMGWSFRKSKKFGPVNVTASKGGIGISVGNEYGRIGRGADGRLRGSVGVPGTGLRYQASQGARRAPSGSSVSIKGFLIVLGVAFVALAVFVGSCAVLVNRADEAAQSRPKPAPTGKKH